MRLLNNSDKISIIHQVNNMGWEPFDRHCCGAMPLLNLKKCLDIIYDKSSIDFRLLNEVYTKTATKSIQELTSTNTAVGFKMRFRPPRDNFPFVRIFPSNLKISRIFQKLYFSFFKRLVKASLKRNEVTVLWAVRQDVLRWGLSKYHGDGTGKSGHIQFKMASNQAKKGELDKIQVDCDRLEKIISHCEKSHRYKRKLMQNFEQSGISTYPILYEDFVANKEEYTIKLLDYLGIRTSSDEIKKVIIKGSFFEKVHSDDYSDFVENHEEVKERFGERFVSWK